MLASRFQADSRFAKMAATEAAKAFNASGKPLVA